MVNLAKTVVYRHRCHCDNANTVPVEGEADEHRFDVDGQPFPWLITEEGAAFTKQGEVYTVLVSILMLDLETKDPIEFRHVSRELPRLGDREFPWALTGPMIYSLEPEWGIPVLTLAFIAEQVDADCDIPDYTPQVDQ